MFPLIGAALGMTIVALLRALSPLGDLGSAVAVTAFSVYVTGAFHEDGLADTADALGGYVSRERALEIMKDSRIGSYGTAAMVLALLLRVALIARLSHGHWVAIVMYGSIARVTPLWLMTHVCHAAPNKSKLKDLTDIGPSRAWLGTLLAALISAICAYFEPASLPRLFASFVAITLVALYFARLAIRRLGGITGDLLGASEQISEITILSVFAWQIR
jgi:adenosylcobinamide-GDP ribazoletransferase